MSEYMSVILNQVVLMLILVIAGLICFMCKIISKDGSKQLSNLLMMVISPVVIFVSYQRDFDPAMLKGLLQAFGLSLVGFAVAIAVAYLFLRKTEKYDVVIERFSTIYSNCGFMGIPLVDAMFGSEGVFYLTAVITAFNLIVWTHGVYTFTGAGEKFSFKGLLNALKSPSIIAVPIGLICFLCNLRVPDVVYDALNYISGMNTPLAMIVAGVTVAQTDLKQVFVKGRIYYVSFLKLILAPMLIVLVYALFPGVPTIVTLSLALAMAAPAGAMGTMFAIRYDRSALYASEIFAATTILSALTLPLIVLAASLLL